MLEIYSDENRTSLIFKTKAVIRSESERSDYHAGGMRRTFSTGDLQTYKRHADKFEETLMLEDVPHSGKEILDEIYRQRQRVYYCPDADRREDELYHIMLDEPTSVYVKQTGLYNIQVQVRQT